MLWAWAAGIIDGEGTICIARNQNGKTKSFTLSLSCEMKCEKTIRKLHYIFGFGGLHKRVRRQENHSNMFGLHLHGREAIAVIFKLLPHLVTKEEQAKLAVEFSEQCFTESGNNKPVPESIQIVRQLIYEDMRALNKRGQKSTT